MNYLKYRFEQPSIHHCTTLEFLVITENSNNVHSISKTNIFFLVLLNFRAGLEDHADNQTSINISSLNLIAGLEKRAIHQMSINNSLAKN